MKTYKQLARLGKPLTRAFFRRPRSRRSTAESSAARRGTGPSSAARRGTVIIVVLALLGMLALIGFFAFAFTASENQAATYFANSPSAKVATPAIDADPFFNDILRQIIIGPSINERQSVLWGGNKSLLPTMFGRDLSPFNGQGINLIWNTTTNQAAVDQNYNNLPEDGTSDGATNNSAFMQINLSPAAQQTVLDLNNFPTTPPSFFPDPDVNTTYPDINSLFLSYDALIPNPTNPTALPTRVIIPSFHRPQLLRNASGGGGNVTVAQWYTDPGTAKLVMYPHVEHVAIDATGTPTTTQRFVTLTHTDTTASPLSPFPIPGDNGVVPPPAEGVWTAPGGTGPITYDVDTDNDGVLDARYMDFGFPLMTTPDGSTQFVALAAVKIIDADALFNLNAHGNRSALAAVPSPNNFGGTGTFLSRSNQGISSSEVNPEWALNARPLAASADFGGNAAALSSALVQYVSFFRAPADSGTLPINNFDPTAGAVSFELANMEWWNILNGRPQLTPSGTPTTTAATISGSSLPGRWGENISRLDPQVQLVLAGTVVAAGMGTPGGDLWPLPGVSFGPGVTISQADDNNNYPESGVWPDPDTGVTYPAFVQPLDYFASGSTIDPAGLPEGKTRLLVAQGAQKFPLYSNYFINSFPLTAATGPVLWSTYFTGALMQGGGQQYLIDEPDETFTEPALAATQTADSIFDASENVIQLSGGDFSLLGSPGRSSSLAPFDFVANTRAAQIRQRFTSTSWDLKSFGKEFFGAYSPTTPVNDARRLWEFTDISSPVTGVGPFRFPPDFGSGSVILAPALTATANTNYPLRLDLAHLLWTVADPGQKSISTALILAQRPLSVNGLVEQVQLTNSTTGTPYTGFRFRPLTPHPTASNPPAALANTPIVVPAHLADGIGYTINRPENLTGPTAGVANQEWLARYDRQRMARDIYTLLYLSGGGSDALNYTSASNQPVAGVRPVYTDDQLQEMAQFAVNTVDALDPDTNITVFEYDKDLSDGWNLDDNPYDSTADLSAPFSIPAADRGVVYGVEAQQLAFNEAMVVFSQQAVNTQATPNVAVDHPDTQWDDRKQWAALYLELDNIGPANVNFNNEQWQIAIKQSPTVTPVPPIFYGTERRLTFQSSQPQLVAGVPSGGFKPRLTIGGLIGSTNGVTYDQINSVSGNPTIPNPSYLAVDPNDTAGAPANTGVDYQFPIVPRAAYVSPSAPPFGMTTALDLDLTQPGTQNQYWVVPPNPGDPTGNADGAPTLITTPAGLSPGTQLLNFTDPITEPTGTISSAPGAHIFPESALVVRIELKRRVDLNRNPILPNDPNVIPESTDNPWVVVDYMDVPVSVLALKKTGNASDFSLQIQNQLGNPAPLADPPLPSQPYHHYVPTGGAMPLVSTERSQPLYHDFTLNPFKPTAAGNATTPNGPYIAASSVVYPRNGGATTLPTLPTQPQLWQGNSLGQDNDAAGFDPGTVTGTPKTAPPHPLYQPHYDRDFASIIELFNVPTWGPYGPASPTTMNVPGVSSGNSIALSSGLTHLMATRTTELGAPIAATLPPPEVLGGTDFIPTDSGVARQHYLGYGTAGYRFQHPEGSDASQPNPAIDFTENRWHRLFGLVEVPTRSNHDPSEAPYQTSAGSLGGPVGFFRTPGKINLNTLRHPDVLAGLLDESDVYGLTFTTAFPTGLNFTPGLSVPSSLPDQNAADQFQAPSPVAGQVRDWWLQFLTSRDGIDPLPATVVLPLQTAGTGLPLPGMPRTPSGVLPPPLPAPGSSVPAGSHPFRSPGFSAYASGTGPAAAFGGVDVNGYNGTLETTILRSLPGDPVTAPTPPPSPDGRRRLFELGTAAEHGADTVDYATKNRVLSKILQNTTTRSNVFLVWIQIDFFTAKDVLPPNGVVRIGSKLGTSPAYRGFFVIDRSQALSLMTPQFLPATDPTTNKFVFSMNQSFNYQSLILYRQRIQ
jgi:hypothetical protein